MVRFLVALARSRRHACLATMKKGLASIAGEGVFVLPGR
jgi:hypothetical protein